jgi:hypothetical protein
MGHEGPQGGVYVWLFSLSNLCANLSCVVNATPRQLCLRGRYPALILQENGWAQELSRWVRKNSPLSGFNSLTVQPVASRYIDYAEKERGLCDLVVHFCCKVGLSDRESVSSNAAFFFFYYCGGLRPCLCETAVTNGPIVHSAVDRLMNINYWWNDFDKAIPKFNVDYLGLKLDLHGVRPATRAECSYPPSYEDIIIFHCFKK